MYQIIDESFTYGLFTTDEINVKRKVATAMFLNLDDNHFRCEISFLEMNHNPLSPYKRDRYTGRYENYNMEQHKDIIRNTILSMFLNHIPDFEIEPIRNKRVMHINQGIQNLPIIHDYTKYANGTWVLIPDQDQLRLNLNVGDNDLYDEINKVL